MQAGSKRSRGRRHSWIGLLAGAAIFAVASQPVVALLGGVVALAAFLELRPPR